MSINFSNRCKTISESSTMALSQKISEKKKSGENIIDLVAGIPKFNTPEIVSNSGKKAINDNNTKYTSVKGIIELNQAVIDRYKRDYDLEINLNEVMITAGAKFGLYNSLACIINPGDEVIIPTPSWVSYCDMVKLLDGKVIKVSSEIDDEFLLTAKKLLNSITNKTKAIILNNPNNPTSQVYTEAKFKLLVEILEKNQNIFIICDDVYEWLCWSNSQPLLKIAPQLKNQIIMVNGVSKGHSMTGWRIGFVIAHSEVIKMMVKFQSQTVSSPCTISQFASVTAIEMTNEQLSYMKEYYYKNTAEAYSILSKSKLLKCLPAGGGFYLFPEVTLAMKKLNIKTDKDFCEMILEKKSIAITAGSSFNLKNHIRISCSGDYDELITAMKHLVNFCDGK